MLHNQDQISISVFAVHCWLFVLLDIAIYVYSAQHSENCHKVTCASCGLFWILIVQRPLTLLEQYQVLAREFLNKQEDLESEQFFVCWSTGVCDSNSNVWNTTNTTKNGKHWEELYHHTLRWGTVYVDINRGHSVTSKHICFVPAKPPTAEYGTL